MVQVEKPKEAKIAAVLIKRAAAIFVSSAKNREISNFLHDDCSICLGSGKQTGSVAALNKISSFKKDAAPDNGAASFFRSIKNVCFR